MKTAVQSNNEVPRVSVVMGIARADPYLQAAIDSILNQSFRDFEFLIVVDEGACHIKDQILDLYPGDERLRILQAPSLGGLAYALNMGIGSARGEYIARMDGDDISRPDRLMEQVRYMDEHKDVAVLGCRVQLIDSNSERMRQKFPYCKSDKEIRRLLPFRCPMVHPALMFRKSSLYRVHGYMYGHSAEDYEMFIRMARNPELKFYNLDKVLFDYRRHELQGTGLHRVRDNYADRAGVLFTEFLRTCSLKYIGGMLAMHPLIYTIRVFFRKSLERIKC